MQHNFKDITGQRFGRLTALSVAPDKNRWGQVMWVCHCDCGGIKNFAGITLRNGDAVSCGCRMAFIQKYGSITHGRCKTPIYRIWGLMVDRCDNPRTPSYINYGGRGIKLCDRWRKFENFLADMGERPSPKHSIDRIDNDGDYEPGNCRWATDTEQCRNRRSSRLITFKGETKTAAEWSEITGLKSRTIRARIDVLGWDVQEALGTPPMW